MRKFEMKMTIATILLALAAGQANADGFYQQVVGNAPQSSQATSNVTTETTYTPLYLQVVGNRDAIDQGKVVIRTPSKTTYTPLYLQVVGHPEKSTSEQPIAGNISGNVDTGS